MPFTRSPDPKNQPILVERFRKFWSLDRLPAVGGFEEVVYVIEERSFYVYSEGSWQVVGGGGLTAGQTITASSGQVALTLQATTNANALNIKNSAGTLTSSFDKDGYGFIVERTFLLAIGSPATTGANKTNQVTMTRSGKFLKCFINAKVGPTGADLVLDLNKNGSTIWSTQANRIKIVAGATTGTQTSFDTTNFVEGDTLTVDVDQVGSTIASQDITLQLVTLCRNGAA